MSSFRQPIQVRQVTGGAYDANGRWSGETEVKETIQASVQPASPKDLLALEEGRRSRASFVLFSKSKLESIGAQNPHRIKLFGDEYEVVGAEPWQNGVRPHFRYIVQKVAATLA